MRNACLLLLACVLSAPAAPSWHQVEFNHQLNAVVVENDSSAWAAGTAGSYLSGFFRWDGADWRLADTFRNKLVYDICSVDGAAWAVGEQFNFPDGIVYRWDGGQWQQQAEPFDRTLQAVAFPDSAHGFAAGAAPVTHHPVMRYAAGTWQLDTALTTRRTILGLASPGFYKCYAVGDSGAIFRYDHELWTQVSSPTTSTLRRVAMESNTEGWAVGNNGTILRCFKDMWSSVPSPTTRNLYGLAVAGTSGEAWAVGDSGTILHMEMDSWHLEPFAPEPPDAPLYSVSFNSGAHGWAFGYRTMGAAVALHYYDAQALEERRERITQTAQPPTIVRGQLVLRAAVGGERPAVGTCLLDATGRRVLDLHPGPNDVSRFAPGVYFVRAVADGQLKADAVRKVVLQR